MLRYKQNSFVQRFEAVRFVMFSGIDDVLEIIAELVNLCSNKRSKISICGPLMDRLVAKFHDLALYRSMPGEEVQRSEPTIHYCSRGSTGRVLLLVEVADVHIIVADGQGKSQRLAEIAIDTVYCPE